MSGAMAAMVRGSYFLEPPDQLVGDEFATLCRDVCHSHGLTQSDDRFWSAFAIAPLCSGRLTHFDEPNHGTLVFHPSALPYRRGPDALRRTIAAGERVSAATWFFANGAYDAGDLCEQEVVVIDYSLASAKDVYLDQFVPAALRALDRAVAFYARTGEFRRVPQDEGLATYDRGRTARTVPEDVS